MRLGGSGRGARLSSASALASAIAPSRGGSTSHCRPCPAPVFGRHLEQVAGVEARLRGDAVAPALSRARSISAGLPSMPSTPRLRRQRQGEVAQAAEQVGHASPGCRPSRRSARADQHAVDVVVDLREVGRLERHADAEFGQRVGELRRRRRRAVHRCPGPWAAATTARVLAAKARSRARSSVASGSRLRSTSAVTSSPTATSICGSRSRACIAAISARSGSSRSRPAGGSDLALRDVGHEARLALVEADQHRVFLGDVAHRQPRAGR